MHRARRRRDEIGEPVNLAAWTSPWFRPRKDRRFATIGRLGVTIHTSSARPDSGAKPPGGGQLNLRCARRPMPPVDRIPGRPCSATASMRSGTRWSLTCPVHWAPAPFWCPNPRASPYIRVHPDRRDDAYSCLRAPRFAIRRSPVRVRLAPLREAPALRRFSLRLNGLKQVRRSNPQGTGAHIESVITSKRVSFAAQTAQGGSCFAWKAGVMATTAAIRAEEQWLRGAA
jgi:hypothetical protein